jgi:RHS repeat-associated protein
MLVALGAAVPAAAQPPASLVEYYHLDALGSVRLVTDQSGQIVRRHDYLPFGEEYLPPATPSDPFRFTGKPRDAETALDYFGARYYRPRTGRFTTVDPATTWLDNLVDPQRWNRYAYAKNGPFTYVDPDGQAVETVWDLLNIALGVRSAVTNLRAGNVLAASIDAAGVVVDTLAAAVPFVPGGAGSAIRAARAVEEIPDAVGAIRQATGGLRSFTRSGFRENLVRLTGRAPEGVHAHHLLPVSGQFANRFARAGLNVNDPRLGAWWAKTDHLRNAKAWNDAWRRFFERNPKASAQEILDEARRLAALYGLPTIF